MPQMQDIVLQDSAETPVDHEFKPISLNNNVGEYRELGSQPYQLQPSIVATIRPPTEANWGQRATWRLTVPLVPAKTSEDECCLPPGVKPRVNHVTIEFFLDKTSPRARAEDLLAMLADLVTDTQFRATCLGENLR